MSYKPGDVVHLKFSNNYKTQQLKNVVNQKHPVLIVNVFSNGQIQIASMSSNQGQMDKNRFHDVILDDWVKSGLDKKTYVDVSTTGIIDSFNVHKVLTHLTNKDLFKVISRLNKVTQRQLFESNTIYNTGYPEFLNYKIDNFGRKVFVDFGDSYANY